MKRKSIKRGFTLIEITMVSVILTVLVTLSVPQFLVHFRRARGAEPVATLEILRQLEREYFARHNSYLAVTSPNIGNDPSDPTPGLGINLGVAQYFSSAAYSVDVPGNSAHFTTNPTSPVDFLIKVSGNLSVACSAGSTDCAVKAGEIANYQLEMDNTGRVFICYENCANAANWQSWNR